MEDACLNRSDVTKSLIKDRSDTVHTVYFLAVGLGLLCDSNDSYFFIFSVGFSVDHPDLVIYENQLLFPTF